MSVKPVHKYLEFTRKNNRGTLLLLTIILLICIVPFIYPLLFRKTIADNIAIDTSLASIQLKQEAVRNKKYNTSDVLDEHTPYDYSASKKASYTANKKGELFNFDPNTISAEGWKKLGLRDKTIATIINYRNKGGKFKQPEDIKKIWGLFPDEAEQLIPFVNIAASNGSSSNNNESSVAKNYSNDFSEPKKYEYKKNYAPININESDTSAWIALPGIGSKLSQRIINFRDKLGGFYAVNQVAETFGLPDSTFQKIKPLLQVSGEVKKINLNTATIEELKTHPYIRYQLGNTIIQYRKQHGDFKSVTDLKKIMIIDATIYDKVFPYLITN